ncbi:hypothetical protein WG66_008186 [Moniliophthora roreri]|nr:hypothetical protein WG66_008186 [Moniliophthora roreri]
MQKDVGPGAQTSAHAYTSFPSPSPDSPNSHPFPPPSNTRINPAGREAVLRQHAVRLPAATHILSDDLRWYRKNDKGQCWDDLQEGLGLRFGEDQMMTGCLGSTRTNFPDYFRLFYALPLGTMCNTAIDWAGSSRFHAKTIPPPLRYSLEVRSKHPSSTSTSELCQVYYYMDVQNLAAAPDDQEGTTRSTRINESFRERRKLRKLRILRPSSPIKAGGILF